MKVRALRAETAESGVGGGARRAFWCRPNLVYIINEVCSFSLTSLARLVNQTPGLIIPPAEVLQLLACPCAASVGRRCSRCPARVRENPLHCHGFPLRSPRACARGATNQGYIVTMILSPAPPARAREVRRENPLHCHGFPLVSLVAPSSPYRAGPGPRCHGGRGREGPEWMSSA